MARVFDEQGRFAPTYFEDHLSSREADVVIMAIGQKADLKFITAADGIKLTPRGLIEAEADTLATSREGVFAGGDVVTGPWIAIGAVAAGREAAISIERYLEGQDLKTDREAPLRPIDPGNWNPIPSGQPKAAREHMPELPQAEWTQELQGDQPGLHRGPGARGGGPVHQLRAVLRVHAVCDGLPGRGHRPQPCRAPPPRSTSGP